MNHSNSDISSKHIDELCLAYVEDVLSVDEKTQIEQHLDRCPSCARQTQDMSRWVTFVKNNRDALCPEEWELFDYAREGRDGTGLLASHVELCPECRTRVEEFRTHIPRHGVPEALWKRMTRLREAPVEGTAEKALSWPYRLWEQVAHAFSPPFALAGAVAAAVLVVVFLYPSAPPTPFLGLSSVSWGPDSTAMSLMGEPAPVPTGVAKKKRLAVIIYFTDFTHKPEADRIDALYRLLEPRRDVRFQYDVVSPKQLKEAVQKAGIEDSTEKEVLSVLRDKLSVSRALILALSEKGDRFTIQARLTDTATGTVLRERKMADVPAWSLQEDVETASESVLKTE